MAFQPVLGMEALPWSGIVLNFPGMVLNALGAWSSRRERVKSKRVGAIMV